MAETDEDPPIPTPRTNPDLIGHDAVEAALKAAADAGRLGQALLITGPKGIGKATLAFRLARYLLANGGTGADDGPGLFGDAPPEPVSDGKGGLGLPEDHPVFRRVAAEAHADLLTVQRAVDPKSGRLKQDIVVDDVRGVKTFMTKTSGEGGFRVVIVDSADEMNRNAANALLKVLEEPPAKAVLLLVAHNPGRLLPTIRSRCRQIALRPLETEAIVGFLGTRLEDQDAAEIRQAALLSGGSLARTLDLLTGDGLAVWNDMSDLLGAEREPDAAKLHAFADRMGRSGNETQFETFATLIEWWLAQGVTGTAKGGKGATEGVPPLTAASGPSVQLDRWLEVWDKARGLLQRTRAVNLDRKQVVLSIFFALAKARSG